MSRYARQVVLPEIGAQGQDQLAKARVLVVGGGGLGVPVLQYLAGAGIGQITVVDGDTVDATNLHRQPLYRMDQVGQSKARAARANLAALNPDVEVTALCQMLDPANAPDLARSHDIVLDCADTFAVSLTLSDVCRDLRKPLISASALGISGYVAGCCATAPSLRAIFPDLPQRGATCATAGVMGPVVGAIGALQAQMALSVVLSLNPSPLGRLLSLDGRSFRMGGFRFDSAAEPDTPLPFIAQSQIAPGDHLIDLRAEAPPFSPRARHIPPEHITDLQPSPGSRVVLACATGLRAHNAGQTLQTYWPGDIALLALHS